MAIETGAIGTGRRQLSPTRTLERRGSDTTTEAGRRVPNRRPAYRSWDDSLPLGVLWVMPMCGVADSPLDGDHSVGVSAVVACGTGQSSSVAAEMSDVDHEVTGAGDITPGRSGGIVKPIEVVGAVK